MDKAHLILLFFRLKLTPCSLSLSHDTCPPPPFSVYSLPASTIQPPSTTSHFYPPSAPSFTLYVKNMGANTSLLSPGSSDGLDNSSELNLGEIPESCVAMVLSYLEPPEICKLARINRAFRAASSADFIWISKLPSNYRHLVEKLLINDKNRLGEKEIFARLSQPVSFDAGNKEFWVEKVTGGVCVAISSKALTITGIDDRRYWNHIPSDESRFGTVAYLKQTWWLEVDGDVEFHFPAGTYALSFKLRLGKVIKRNGRRACSTEDVHGWNVKPVELKLTTATGQHTVAKRFLKTTGDWEYHRVGEFTVDDSNKPTKVKFSLTQIDCTHTKGGLSIDSVLICPKSV